MIQTQDGKWKWPQCCDCALCRAPETAEEITRLFLSVGNDDNLYHGEFHCPATEMNRRMADPALHSCNPLEGGKFLAAAEPARPEIDPERLEQALEGLAGDNPLFSDRPSWWGRKMYCPACAARGEKREGRIAGSAGNFPPGWTFVLIDAATFPFPDHYREINAGTDACLYGAVMYCPEHREEALRVARENEQKQEEARP